jgi:hypothetical protein
LGLIGQERVEHLVCDTRVKAIKDARNANKNCRPQHHHIIEEGLWRALPVPNARSNPQEQLLSDTIKDVGQRQV